MASTNVNLNVEKYNTFLRCITTLKEDFNDIDINDGFIRQRSNDKTSIIQIDLNTILPNATMTISDIKKKLDLFKMFAGQEVNLEINNDENGYFIISDTLSKYKFMSPAYQFIDNKFMPQNELDVVFNLNEERLILEHELQPIITERIKITTLSFNLKSIQVLFNAEKALIKAVTQAKDQFATFVEDIDTNMIIENCSANLGIIPFYIDHDRDVKFKMYQDSNPDISLNTFESEIGECKMIIYSRSSLIQNEE